MIDGDVSDLGSNGKIEYKIEYTMRLTYEITHKLNVTSKDLGIPKEELIETLLREGLKSFLDPKRNPANRPVKSAREVLLDVVRKVAKFGAPPAAPVTTEIAKYRGVPSNARPVRPGELEPEMLSHPDSDQEQQDEEDSFGLYDE